MSEERVKTRPRRRKGVDEGTIEEQSPHSGDAGKIDDAAKAADEAKRTVEKLRKRARERMAQVTNEDVQVKHRDKQRPGE